MEEVTRFYEWLLKVKSIHLADNQGANKHLFPLQSKETM